MGFCQFCTDCYSICQNGGMNMLCLPESSYKRHFQGLVHFNTNVIIQNVRSNSTEMSSSQRRHVVAAGDSFEDYSDLIWRLAIVSASQNRVHIQQRKESSYVVFRCQDHERCGFKISAKTTPVAIVISDDMVLDDMAPRDGVDDVAWVVTKAMCGHSCPRPEKQKGKKSTPFDASMFVDVLYRQVCSLAFPISKIVSCEFCKMQVQVEPLMSGALLRASCAKKVEDEGISGDLLPHGIEYDVKKRCLESVFGDPKGWYNELRLWMSAYTAADDLNYAVLDVEDGRYLRSFVAPGVCRRLLG